MRAEPYGQASLVRLAEVSVAEVSVPAPSHGARKVRAWWTMRHRDVVIAGWLAFS
jgi:hypothetical protein